MPILDRQARRIYNLRWIQQRKREAYAAMGGACVGCGSIEKLELDHIDRRMKVSHRIWTWSAARRTEEIAKCQLLCVDCHKKKTRYEWIAARRHGTRTMYEIGCRCDECRGAQRAHVRAWRARRGAA